MPLKTKRTWMLLDSIINSQDNNEKLAMLGQLHDALRREPANIRTLLPKIFSIKSEFNDDCKVALCRMIEEIAGRGMVPEDARTEDDFCNMLGDSREMVQKRVIRSYTALYPQVMMHLYMNPYLELWRMACDLKLKIVSFLQSQNDGILEYVIRFMHGVILIQLERNKSTPILPSDKLGLDACPDNHSFLHKEELRMEANLLINECLNILSSPKSRIGPLTSIVAGMVGLSIMRPQLQILIAKPLLEVTQDPPQGLNNMERESFIRCIRNFFISVYRVPTTSPTSKIFKEAAVALGSKPMDLLKFQKTGKYTQPYVKQSQTVEEPSECTSLPDLPNNIDPSSFTFEQIMDIIIHAISTTPDDIWEQAIKTLSLESLSEPAPAKRKFEEIADDPKNNISNETPMSPPLDIAPVGTPEDKKDIVSTGDMKITLERIMESPDVDGDSLFLELLKSILGSERYFSSERAQPPLKDSEQQSTEPIDKRMSLSALKLGWYLIVSKLSVSPLLSLEKRKTQNGSMTTGYNIKTYEMLISFFFENIRSRFELMILWLNHIWIIEKRERKKTGTSKQEGEIRGYFYWIDYMLDQFCTKLSPNDKVITKFLVEIPEISDRIINRIAQKYCEQKSGTEMGLFILQALASLRPSARDTCLKYLLEYTIREEKYIRIPAIIACKRLYIGNSTLESEIEDFALKSIYVLLKEHFPSEGTGRYPKTSALQVKDHQEHSESTTSSNPELLAESERIRDKAIAHSELYFVLCSIKQELSSEIFKLFKDFSPEVQKGIAIALDPLIRSLSSQPGRLMDLVKTFPGEANFIAELARNAIRSRERGTLQ